MSHSHSRSCCSSGAGKRIFGILAVGAIAAVAVSLFSSSSSRPRVSPSPVPAKMAGMSEKKLQSYASDNAIVGGATAAQNVLAGSDTKDEPTFNPNPTVRVSVKAPSGDGPAQMTATHSPSEVGQPGRPRPVIRLKAHSAYPQPNRDMAIHEALLAAQKQIGERLRALDPPIEEVPSIETIRSEYLRHDTIAIKQVTDKLLIAKLEEAKNGSDWMDAHIDVEVSADQVRKLRSGGRIESAGWLGALAFALVAALFGFLRVDGWTKGYLTTALAIMFAGAVGGAVVLFFSAR